jgi:hypothetical protein
MIKTRLHEIANECIITDKIDPDYKHEISLIRSAPVSVGRKAGLPASAV